VTSGRFTVIVAAIAVVAIVAVIAASGGIDWPFGGDDDSAEEASSDFASDDGGDTPEPAQPEEPAEPEDDGDDGLDLPDNPDDVRGTAPYALTRTTNFHAAMAVLDDRRQRVEGVFESLRVAPGRIDTVIVHPDDRRTNIQIRPDMRISFESTHDFPTQADFRDRGLTARMVRGLETGALLRAVDRVRPAGNAFEDVDYIVVSRGPIAGGIDESAYMRIRTARPRYFTKEGRKVRAIG
jgi:hypothetical protein